MVQRAVLVVVFGDLVVVGEMRDAFYWWGCTMYWLLLGIDGVYCFEFEGAFYCFLLFKGVFGCIIGGYRLIMMLELVEVLLNEVKVVVVLGEVFGAFGYLRFLFVLGDDDFGEGIGWVVDLLS